jgi:stage II sporulation protein D
LKRIDFLAGIVPTLILAPSANGGDVDKADPANQTASQALRVLLGRGQAQRLDGQTFIFEGRRYRGEFVNASEGVVSTVPLEQYLYSVISREMPHSWPDRALQAQAIIARTYVLQRSNPRRDYDLVPSEADQVYTGVDAEHPSGNAAVDATAGVVLRFRAGFASVMYSSCCGGHTEASFQAWSGPPLQYLNGVVCPYCTDSPWYAWTQNVTLDQLHNALVNHMGSIGDLKTITLEPPDASGRSRFWDFAGTNGMQRLKAADIRRALGTRTLPSLLVRRLAITPDSVRANRSLVIEGAGLGHGVGLCQWGARGMALSGADARAILSFYFPGTGVGNV